MEIKFYDRNGTHIKTTKSISDERNKIGHTVIEEGIKYKLFDNDYRSENKYKKYKEVN